MCTHTQVWTCVFHTYIYCCLTYEKDDSEVKLGKDFFFPKSGSRSFGYPYVKMYVDSTLNNTRK